MKEQPRRDKRRGGRGNAERRRALAEPWDQYYMQLYYSASYRVKQKVCQRRRKSVGGQRGFRVAVAGGDGSGGGSGVVHRETVRIRSRRPGGWQGPLDSVGYGKLARVTEFPSSEHDEGTIQEVAREFDYREHDYDDNCGADDRCQDDCDDCQHEDRIAAEESNDDDDDDYDTDDENNVCDEQNAANDNSQVDNPRHADDDVEDGSCARSDCRCSRKFLVPRAVEDLCCCAVRISSSRGYLYPSVVRLVGAGVVVRRLPIPRVTGYYCRPTGRSPTRTRSAVDCRVTTEGHYPTDGARVDDQLSLRYVTLRYVADDNVRDGDRYRVDDSDGDEDEDEDEDDDDDDDNGNDDDDDDDNDDDDEDDDDGDDEDDDDDDDYDDSNNDDDVGDMCGCATSTRRGLGTAAGKSARRAKSSCSVHRTPGIR
ncbi:Replicase polyprotein 1a [Acromyrmex echinatior]|uniref:Replicase polyprotein 1a n=1 Tax=Acromyrmex echinatior TaxID=103372 RepID=F4WCW1_ACREC|nr:Replicase polyprotein 1a [Acromyrmex echinatior]